MRTAYDALANAPGRLPTSSVTATDQGKISIIGLRTHGRRSGTAPDGGPPHPEVGSDSGQLPLALPQWPAALLRRALRARLDTGVASSFSRSG